jgi:imidazolonepropionase-like amidohydrolase
MTAIGWADRKRSSVARRLCWPALLGLLAGCTAPAVAPGENAARVAGGSEVLAFVDVNVIPMDRERVLRGQTVVVRDGRIVALGAAGSVSVPAGAARIEAAGRYLMPGLAEMHAHLPPPQAGEAAIERTLFLYLAGGVTLARGMLGHPLHLELRERTARGELLGPHIVTSGPSFNGNSAPTPETAVRMVREQHAAGYDFLKIHPGLSRVTYDMMAATAAEIGIPFAGHVPLDVGLLRALEARQATIDHLDGYVEAMADLPAGLGAGFFGFAAMDQVDRSRIDALAAATREAGVWNVPTQSLLEHLFGPDAPETLATRPEMRYMPAATVQQWAQTAGNLRSAETFSAERAERFIELRRQLIHALHRAGAGLLLGSDAPQIFNVPGFAIQHELRMLVDAGLTPYEALATGTRSPAVFFGQADDFGTVAVGRRADLVLLDADPLADIRNVSRIAGVMIHGRWLPAAEIERRLEAIAAELRP